MERSRCYAIGGCVLMGHRLGHACYSAVSGVSAPLLFGEGGVAIRVDGI